MAVAGKAGCAVTSRSCRAVRRLKANRHTLRCSKATCRADESTRKRTNQNRRTGRDRLITGQSEDDRRDKHRVVPIRQAIIMTIGDDARKRQAGGMGKSGTASTTPVARGINRSQRQPGYGGVSFLNLFKARVETGVCTLDERGGIASAKMHESKTPNCVSPVRIDLQVSPNCALRRAIKMRSPSARVDLSASLRESSASPCSSAHKPGP